MLYEVITEFYHEANQIGGRILLGMLLLPLLVGVVAVILVFLASRILTEPIRHMIDVIRNVKRGRLRERMQIEAQDELGELASSFNRIADIIQNFKHVLEGMYLAPGKGVHDSAFCVIDKGANG